MINVKAYRRWNQPAKWTVTRRPTSRIRDPYGYSMWVICCLRDCRKWSDLYCLAKWLLATHILIHSPRRCWARLASWSWLRWDERESVPLGGDECKAEARKLGSCWCGKFCEPVKA